MEIIVGVVFTLFGMAGTVFFAGALASMGWRLGQHLTGRVWPDGDGGRER